MQALVIIPTTKIKYEFGFSAPLCWLFSAHAGQVHGIYSPDLTQRHVQTYQTFIIELNWYLEFHEFTLLVAFIKQHNPTAQILFGGLFASLMYEKIFEKYPVDYYIKGDNELPLHLFLSGEPPQRIPNFKGRGFDNPIEYHFEQSDYHKLEFNLDWFPDYFRHLKERKHDDLGRYRLPMLITSKGGCTTVHEGCDYCMGAHHRELHRLYDRPPVVMDNDTLLQLIGKLEKRFTCYSIYITSPFSYDFRGQLFNGTANIEIDCPITYTQVKNLLAGFKQANLLIPIYSEGIMGSRIIDYARLLELEDENHRIQFPAYTYDRESLAGVPERNIMFNLDNTFAASWAYWEIYTDFTLAAKNSRSVYFNFLEEGLPAFRPGQVE